MHHQSIGEDGVKAQRVRHIAIVHSVDDVVLHHAGFLVVQRNRHVGLGRFAIVGEQVDLGSCAIERLRYHLLQHLLEDLGCCGVVVGAHALQAVLLAVLQPDTDNERLQHDALGLQRTAHRARIFITGFDAIGNEDDDVPYLSSTPLQWREIAARLFKRPRDGRGAEASHLFQCALHAGYAIGAEGHFKFRVVAVLLSRFNARLVTVYAQRQLQIGLAFQFGEALQQERARHIYLRLVAPERVHAVARIEHEEHAGKGAGRLFVLLRLQRTDVQREQNKKYVAKE